MIFSAIHDAMRKETFSLEAIDFQLDKSFGKAIEAELEYLFQQRMDPSAVRRSRIGKIIEDFTGMACIIESDVNDEYALYMNYEDSLNRNHAFLQWQREYLDGGRHVDFLKEHGRLQIDVDLARGRVLGLPKEMRHVIGIGAGWKSLKGITPALLTAGILHEVGHWLAYYVWIARSLSTNFLLTDFTSRIIGTHDPIKRLEIIEEAKKAGIKNDVFMTAQTATSVEDLQLVIIASEVKESRSALGIDIYDTRAWEQLADQYAARWGYALQTAQLVDLIMREFGATGWAWNAITILGELCILVSFAITASLLIVTVPAGLTALIGGGVLGKIYIGLVCFTMGMIAFGTDHQRETYDSIKRRFEVLRKQLVAQLKVTKNKEIVRSVLDDIAIIDKVIENTVDNVSLFKFLQRNFGFISGRRIYRHTTTQKLLEDFANTDLNVALAKLENEV